MGARGISADDLSNHFTVEGKAVFYWLLTKYVETVEPYDDDELDDLETWSLIGSFTTLFLALFFCI